MKTRRVSVRAMRFFPFQLLLAMTGMLSAQDGAAIYAQHCASCHGEHGEGVTDEVDEPLAGARSLKSLSRYIDKQMPEDDPDLLDADQSQRVAEYIHGAFYSPEARAKKSAPPKAAFARLTNRQFRESVADLIGSFGKSSPPGDGSGLKGQYFQSDGKNKKARRGFERVDAKISFDFGEGPPADGIAADQFSIAWDGSLLAPETGWYEFKIRTPNGARLYLNGDSQDGDGDDSGAKRQVALIDAWVSSGTDIRESTARIFLLGGRSYAMRFDFFKYLDKRGMVSLEWKPPHGEWAILSAPYLSPTGADHVAVVTAAFPADDASEGYERGTGISKDWHEASTAAAVEAANLVVTRISQLAGVKNDAPDRVEKIKQFAGEFAERAFRRPLTDELRTAYVDRAFANDLTADQSLKRAVILILKSPRFLYPELGAPADDFTVANRLALGLWDSVPDQTLIELAMAKQLHTPEQVKAQAQRMASDPRAKAKLNGFFQRWLKLDVEGELSKDPTAFPGFDATLVADLRRSLELFVERVVWSEASDYRQLIEADYLLFNDRLAHYYGVPKPEGDGFQAVKFDASQRAGVLTHPYVLARLSHHAITSPIHRGVFLTRNVLGGFLKPPPEAVAFEDHKFDPKLTMREKVAEMTRSASCMTCHETINPLGFSLENFDAVGRFRTLDGDKPINAVSDFLTIEGETLRLSGPRDVATHAVKSDAARQGFIRQVFQYTIKQNPAVYGHDTIRDLDTTFTNSGHHVRNLLAEITTTAALRAIHHPEQATR